jgi:ribosome-binding protein aMBF1 (putative translation factor)
MHTPLIADSFSPVDSPAVASTTDGAFAENANKPLDISTRFGARLRTLRQERNMTQLRMATEFGIDRSFISDVERGKKSISLPMLEVIALGMKITLSELLDGI